MSEMTGTFVQRRQSYYAYQVLYNVMDEETIVDLWCRLESLYMTKSLSNKLFMKKQLYSLKMKECTSILQHLNAFNRILSDLLALKDKLEEEEKALLLLSSFPLSYDHLATTIMYGKETLELKMSDRCSKITY